MTFDWRNRRCLWVKLRVDIGDLVTIGLIWQEKLRCLDVVRGLSLPAEESDAWDETLQHAKTQ
eukprot:3631986-Rhodomonas_salina.3